MSAIGNAILRWRDYRGIPLKSDEIPTTAELAAFVTWEDDQRRAAAAATAALNHGQGGAAPSPQKQVQRPRGQQTGVVDGQL